MSQQVCLRPGHGYQAGRATRSRNSPTRQSLLNNFQIARIMSEPVFVAFATQKVARASQPLLRLRRVTSIISEGVDVLVIDCDDRQHSQKDYRENDLAVTGENPYLKRLCQNFYKKFEKRHTRLYSPIQPKRRKSLLTELKKAQTPMWCF